MTLSGDMHMKLNTVSFRFKLKCIISFFLNYFARFSSPQEDPPTRVVRVQKGAYTLWKILEGTDIKRPVEATEKMVYLQLNEKMKWVG